METNSIFLPKSRTFITNVAFRSQNDARSVAKSEKESVQAVVVIGLIGNGASYQHVFLASMFLFVALSLPEFGLVCSN